MSFQLTQLLRQRLGDQVAPQLLEEVTRLQERAQVNLNGIRSELDKIEDPQERRLIINEHLAVLLADIKRVMGEALFYEVFADVNVKALHLLT